MSFIGQWLLKTVRQAVEDNKKKSYSEPSEVNFSNIRLSTGPAVQSSSLDSDKGINFKVYKATGGTIIETTFYDRSRDRVQNSLHVITDDKDIGKELGKIITMESLKT